MGSWWVWGRAAGEEPLSTWRRKDGMILTYTPGSDWVALMPSSGLHWYCTSVVYRHTSGQNTHTHIKVFKPVSSFGVYSMFTEICVFVSEKRFVQIVSRNTGGSTGEISTRRCRGQRGFRVPLLIRSEIYSSEICLYFIVCLSVYPTIYLSIIFYGFHRPSRVTKLSESWLAR